MQQFVERAISFNEKNAIISGGETYTYKKLLDTSAAIAQHLIQRMGPLQEKRIAFLLDPSFAYVAAQWGIWRAGGIAVPLAPSHPVASLSYVLTDSGAQWLITDHKFSQTLLPLQQESHLELLAYPELIKSLDIDLPIIAREHSAMILYTSGTTNKPKGVVSTHANIENQIQTLVSAWEWCKNDHILNVLPMHHVHGIINILSCALWSGGCCEFLPKFEAETVWKKFGEGSINLFMAVPTIYYKLINYWEQVSKQEKGKLSASCQSFRLMVSGSAALPVSTLEKWKEISGMTLLERYGMTEIGMALSNPYHGSRRAGYVGKPLPGVQVRVVDGELNEVDPGTPGEILIKGPNVFKEYWQKPKANHEAFTSDGWFKTGDVARVNNGWFKILGRNSVDIIKSGGYKISALEIEDVMRKHENIEDCAVVGIPDEEWGEMVAAALIPVQEPINFTDIKEWLKNCLPGYKIPRKFMILKSLPRNVLGKVTKNELKKMFL